MAIRGACPELQAQDRDEDTSSIVGGRLSRAAQIYYQRRLNLRAWVSLTKVRLNVKCAQKRDALNTKSRMHLEKNALRNGPPTQLTSRSVLNDHPSPTQVLDFFTIYK